MRYHFITRTGPGNVLAFFARTRLPVSTPISVLWRKVGNGQAFPKDLLHQQHQAELDELQEEEGFEDLKAKDYYGSLTLEIFGKREFARGLEAETFDLNQQHRRSAAEKRETKRRIKWEEGINELLRIHKQGGPSTISAAEEASLLEQIQNSGQPIPSSIASQLPEDTLTKLRQLPPHLSDEERAELIIENSLERSLPSTPPQKHLPPHIQLQQQQQEEELGSESSQLSLRHTITAPTFPRNSTISSLIVSDHSPLAIKAISELSRRLNSHSTIVLLCEGLGIYETLLRDVFPDPHNRPHFILAHMSHRIGRDMTDGWEKGYFLNDLDGNLRFGVVPDSLGRWNFDKGEGGVPLCQRSPADKALEDSQRLLLTESEEILQHKACAPTPETISLVNTVEMLNSMTPLNPIHLPIEDMHAYLLQQIATRSTYIPVSALFTVGVSGIDAIPEVHDIWLSLLEEASQCILRHLTPDGSTEGPKREHVEMFDPMVLLSIVTRDSRKAYNDISFEQILLNTGSSGNSRFTTGHIIALGLKYGIPTPVTSTVSRMISVRSKLGLMNSKRYENKWKRPLVMTGSASTSGWKMNSQSVPRVYEQIETQYSKEDLAERAARSTVFGKK